MKFCKPCANFLMAAFLLLLVTAMGACGGGSSGGTDNITPQITKDNVLDLTLNATTIAFGVRDLTFAIGPNYSDLEVGLHTLPPYQGNCGPGEMHSEYSLNSNDGKFSGTRTFDVGFCDNGLGLTGEFQVDATLDMNTMTPTEISSTFNNLNFRPTPDESVTINGVVNFVAAEIKWTIDLVVTDNNATTSYTLTEWLLSLTHQGDSIKEEFSGAYVDSRHGSVTISGFAEIMLPEENPFHGQLEATAPDGSKGRLDFKPEYSYEVHIDSGSGYVFVGTCDFDSVCSF